MTPKTDDAVNPELVGGDWIVRFEPRTMDDVRAIVQPSIPRMNAASPRCSGCRRSISACTAACSSPLSGVRQQSDDRVAARSSIRPNCPVDLFSERNPLMQQVAQMAEQVRQHRQPAAPDNPLLAWQARFSDGMVAALDGYRDLRDKTLEQIFLAIYSSPLLQALVGLPASDESPRRRPEIEPERLALIQQRIAELKSRIAEGGLHEAAIRSLVYIGLAGDGRGRARLQRIAENSRRKRRHVTGRSSSKYCASSSSDCCSTGMPRLPPSRRCCRPILPCVRKTLEVIRRTVEAVGKPSGERAERLAEIEKLFTALQGRFLQGAVDPKKAGKSAARKTTRSTAEK